MTRLKSHDKRLDKMDAKNFVPFGNFRWVIGILVCVVMSLYGFAIKSIYDSQTTLSDIRIKQQITIHKLENLHNNVKDLKKGK